MFDLRRSQFLFVSRMEPINVNFLRAFFRLSLDVFITYIIFI